MRSLSTAAKYEPHVSIDNKTMEVVIGPQSPGSLLQEHSATCIFMHGLGDTARGWADAAHWMAQALPWVKFVLPTATNLPVTLNGGVPMPAWYDIHGLVRVLSRIP